MVFGCEVRPLGLVPASFIRSLWLLLRFLACVDRSGKAEAAYASLSVSVSSEGAVMACSISSANVVKVFTNGSVDLSFSS